MNRVLQRSLGPLAAAAVLLFSACGDDEASAAARKKENEPKHVRTARATKQQLGTSVMVSGTLGAFDRATVAAKVAGRIQVIAVDLGTRVSRGQRIAQIDPTDYRIRLETAEAALAQARVRLGLSPNGGDEAVDLSDTPPVREARAVLDEARARQERYVVLQKDGVISKADYDTVISAVRVAESRYQEALEEIRNRQGVMMQRRAEVALARQQLADTAVYAAFDGVVEKRESSPGEYLAAGATIAEIVKVNPLRFRAEVPEREALSIRIGQEVQLAIDGTPGNFTGRVTRLSPTIAERTRVLTVEADIPNMQGILRAGSFARANILTGASEPAITVPTDAVTTFAGIQKVVLVADGKAKENPITVGRTTAGVTEVLSGLKPGDEVVLNPVNIRSGQPLVTAGR